MNIVDLPVPVPRELYEEALQTYVALASSRSVAIYRVGNVRFPGLSDIDVLVIPKRASAFNRHAFSARQRLPRAYLPLFLHEPFILPPPDVPVVAYTTHSPVLLAGDDVLRTHSRSDEPNERACRLLEGYCAYRVFLDRALRTQTLRARMTVAVASALRFALREGEPVIGATGADAYGAEIDAIRASFFDDDPRRGVVRAFERFRSAFEDLEARLTQRFDLPGSPGNLAAVQQLLRGEHAQEPLDSTYAAHRYEQIERYHRDLAAYGFPYGHLFFGAAYPGAARLANPTTLRERVVHRAHGVWGRIERYAHA